MNFAKMLWTVVAVIVAMVAVVPDSAEAGKGDKSHTIIVRSGGGGGC